MAIIEKIIGIYKITNLINNKVYIGQSCDIYKRWKQHHKIGKKPTHHLKRAMLKYGISNFKFEILRKFSDGPLTQILLNTFEINYISLYNSCKSELGYNKKEGGIGGGKANAELKERMSASHVGLHHSEETKKVMSDSRKALYENGIIQLPVGKKNGMFGKTHSDEAKQKISKVHKGKKLSDEHKKHISENSVGMLGKHHSDSAKQKMSKAKKGKPLSEDHRKILSVVGKGRVLSDEHKQKIAKSNTGQKHDLIICPYCGKEGGNRTMKRWHFDKCKFKPVEDK